MIQCYMQNNFHVFFPCELLFHLPEEVETVFVISWAIQETLSSG